MQEPKAVSRTRTINKECVTVGGSISQQSANILQKLGKEHARIMAGGRVTILKKAVRKEWEVPTIGERATAERMLIMSKRYGLDKKDRRALRSLIKCQAYGIGLPPKHRERYNKLISGGKKW